MCAIQAMLTLMDSVLLCVVKMKFLKTENAFAAQNQFQSIRSVNNAH